MLELRRGGLMQGRAEGQQGGRDRLRLRSGRGLRVIGAKVRAARGGQRSSPEQNANQQHGSAGAHCTSLGQCDQRVKRRIDARGRRFAGAQRAKHRGRGPAVRKIWRNEKGRSLWGQSPNSESSYYLSI